MAIAALLWNLLGCMAFLSDATMSAEQVASLSAAQQALYNARPGWALAATGLAVFGGALGCVGLIVRRKWAGPLFGLSLLGLAVQDGALLLLPGAMAAAGAVALVLQTVVLLIAVGLIALSRKAVRAGWA